MIFFLVHRYSGAQQKITLKLPVVLNKYITPAEMDATTFFTRWKALSRWAVVHIL